MKIIKLLTATTASLTILSLTQPAKAVIFDWQFTNIGGTVGASTDIVQGEVEFNNGDVFANATNVAATRLTITSITGLTSTSVPFFGDGGIELNFDLVPDSVANSFNFDASSNISSPNFTISVTDNLSDPEFFTLEGGFSQFLSDSDSYENGVATFTQQSAVPFEFSPTLGLLVVGGICASSRYIKYRRTAIK